MPEAEVSLREKAGGGRGNLPKIGLVEMIFKMSTSL